MSSFGGGRSRGHSRGRGGGRSYGRSNYNDNRDFVQHPQCKLKPCREWTSSGRCNRGKNCGFAHVVKMHASIQASSSMRDHRIAPVSDVAIWETQGAIKIFSSSHDGFFRLWNAQGGNFNKEFEQELGSTVKCLTVASNFLFCGFESTSPQLAQVTVGMIHAWNLASPAAPPLEFHMQPNLIPYAHATCVTALQVLDQTVVSGSQDGVIRVWKFVDNAFQLQTTLHGHAREVTGLTVVDNTILWSCSIDGSIRIWDLQQGGVCRYAIAPDTASAVPNATANNATKGHSNAVTGLMTFTNPAGTFVLSCSLDGTVKAWNGRSGECVASESHGEGVLAIAPLQDNQGNELLLIGLEHGNIMVRTLAQTPRTPAFTALFVLTPRVTIGHQGPVRALQGGPSGTFYSGGDDGAVLVLQINGDLGL